MPLSDQCVAYYNHLRSLYLLKVDLVFLNCFFCIFYVSVDNGSILYISKYSYTLLDVIPAIRFHMIGRHEIGKKLSIAFPLPGYLRQSVVILFLSILGSPSCCYHVIDLCCHIFIYYWKILQLVYSFWPWTFPIGNIPFLLSDLISGYLYMILFYFVCSAFSSFSHSTSLLWLFSLPLMLQQNLFFSSASGFFLLLTLPLNC